MDEKKSAAYKALVEDMQKKYPAYGTNFKSKLSGKNSIATPQTKKIASNFYDDFDDVEEFYNVLESWGLDWTKTGNDATTRMWAINSLGNAIADGFEFEKVVEKILNSPLPLWAPVVNGEIICKEINFYTYWQGLGYAEKTPKIKYLLVAQDWGNLNLSQDFVDGIKKWNDGDRTPLYTEKPIGIGTDTNLFILFKILGYDLSKRYDELFFTNFCLGYRSGKAVGGMTKELLMNDSAEFKRLCEILQPENILCLGKITFESVFETLTGNKIKINDRYNDFVDKNPFFPANCGETASKIFPLAHCGYMGTLNRKLEKQIEDWKRILDFSEQVIKIEEQPKTKKTALYGAILGDIIGSPFEFRSIRHKSKDFELFSEKSKFTDDTVMTIAIADAILKTGCEKDGRILFKNVEKSMRCYGKKYPHAGYGRAFRKWLQSENSRPYNSFGNGSAMRVSAAGWIFNSIFETRECARMTARPTHNHPEGVKGAMAVASAIFLARKGSSKEVIKDYIEIEFGYNFSRTLDDIRRNYEFNVTCQGSVPESIIAFLESKNFEDAIRNAVSLGGDTDTQAAIAGSIAEAFYGVPENLIKKCREYLPQEFLDVIDKFNFGKGYLLDDLENYSLEKKIAEFNKIPSEINFKSIKQEILDMLKKNNPMENELTGFFTVLQNNENDGQASCQADTLEKGGKEYDVFFTNTCEVMKHKHINGNSQLVISDITEIFRVFEEIFFDDEDYGGLVINPYGENPIFLERNDLKEILDGFHSEIFGEEKEYPAEFSRKNFSNDYPDEFTRKHLSNELLTKKFFADARFIHTSASGAMGEAGVFEVWNKNFEHYRCYWTGNFDVEKFHEAFMKDEDTPYFNEPVKNGWCFHYMGCGHNFYIKEELNAEYLRKFDKGLKNGKDYPHDEDVFPVEEIMLEILRNQKN